jgi:hypothetical protein
MHDSDILFLDPLFDCRRGRGFRVSMWNNKNKSEKKLKKILVLPYYFLMQHSEIPFLDRQFGCFGGRVQWVSAWNNKDACEKDEYMKNIFGTIWSIFFC